MIRAFVALLAGLVALVALAVTLPVAWVAVNVSDRDGYVAFTAPFAQDEELRTALREGVAETVVSEANLGFGEQALRDVALVAIDRVLEDPGFPEAWERTQEVSHDATFADADQQRIVLDIAPVVELVVAPVGDQVGAQLPTPDSVIVPVTTEAEPATIAAVAGAPSRALLGAAVLAGASLLCWVVARRTSTALGLWGVGVAAVSGALMLATGRAVPALLEARPADTELATTMRDLLVARATASFDDWLLLAVAVGAAAALVGLGARVVAR
ncbi:hypothetical protein GCM10009821_22320 [Aeromicrobium halocynthiae]|uniref:Integral membrane protein n=1 Tax=Aeromicrobium halocynthiae TaxID=560557 RepID=A0ABN2W336_9ACTN